jgi:formamidase
LSCWPGDDVVMTTRDAVDGQFTMTSTHEDVPRVDRSIVCPMTGPIRVEGAEPGDLLVVDVLEVMPSMVGEFLTTVDAGRWGLRDPRSVSRTLTGISG